MLVRALVGFGNAFVVAYSLDAGLSLLDEAGSFAFGSTLLTTVRNIFAWAVVAIALAVLPAMALTPRLAPSVFAPLAASALWFALGSPPLALWLEPDTVALLATLLQAALAMAAFWRIRRLSGGRRWLLDPTPAPARDFRFVYTLGMTAAIVVCAVAMMAVAVPVQIVAMTEQSTAGFIQFDAEGVSQADCRYQRGGQEIRLIGMVHIGEADAYDSLYESFAGESTVVLAEGVSDREGLLAVEPSYGPVAESLGLTSQGGIDVFFEEAEPPGDERWADVRHADIDLSEFHPDTRAWLDDVWGAWRSDDPLEAFQALSERYAEHPERWEVFFEDLLDRRNVHLVQELRTALDEYRRIIVPWGALHLPHIEEQVLEMGFEPAGCRRRLLIGWSGIAQALAETSARAPLEP